MVVKYYYAFYYAFSQSAGTGIVTSVPSDSPDDFAALRDLQRKPVSGLEMILLVYVTAKLFAGVQEEVQCN